jgi:plastocyanin
MKRHASLLIAAIALTFVVGAACGGGSYGGGGNPTGPGGGTSGGGIGATVTIKADGSLDPKEVRIAPGERVRFINQDSRPHQPTSNPHLQHTDCPPANLNIMSPGQSMDTGVFERAMVCGIHDHQNPDATALQGTIRVGAAEGPGGPVYVKQ